MRRNAPERTEGRHHEVPTWPWAARANALAGFLRFGLATSRRQENTAIIRPVSSLRTLY
ncbi:hypothetical protein ACFC0D_19270 [Streptomyces sp. NPDC056222]|uniref:hypothetical protein n=1 Tax=Streptomyces sp. NPDC056222 TaxID=3345749 RepID=UPI0035DD7EFD